ncbi:hypothetical protein [Actinokineospora bangkokensis]|uniref:Uncharacterized protein n=1 Tax=Actinokineospora bangkokensis TaxID=1193682 RepID=A0A1Q9LKU1_9PSEU|nr:hypothetical protein [Actinokineospora bangkokensis]OLR92599.1 hypothetical protein BJP25_21350 [Actinokineospora bangkokensis]
MTGPSPSPADRAGGGPAELDPALVGAYALIASQAPHSLAPVPTDPAVADRPHIAHDGLVQALAALIRRLERALADRQRAALPTTLASFLDFAGQRLADATDDTAVDALRAIADEARHRLRLVPADDLTHALRALLEISRHTVRDITLDRVPDPATWTDLAAAMDQVHRCLPDAPPVICEDAGADGAR